MLNCMRVPILLLAAFALTLPNNPARTEDAARPSIVQAYQLWRGGQPKEAIAILEPMWRLDAQTFTEEERGAAWDLLGSSYQDLEIFNRPSRAYGKAVQTLRSVPSAQAQYAAALNNFATLEQTHDGRVKDAISSIQQAVDRWIHAHGPTYLMLATVYLLRAQAFAKSGDYARALEDAQHALAIDDVAIGRSTLGYLTAETKCAQILRASGAKEQASRLNKEASSALAELESRQCNGCTIDANGFR
jgi:tetratricopeptide (TPR) repeat protein